MTITIENQCEEGVDIVSVTVIATQKQTKPITKDQQETIQINSVDTVVVDVDDKGLHYDVKAHNNGTTSTNLRLSRMCGEKNGDLKLGFI